MCARHYPCRRRPLRLPPPPQSPRQLQLLLRHQHLHHKQRALESSLSLWAVLLQSPQTTSNISIMRRHQLLHCARRRNSHRSRALQVVAAEVVQRLHHRRCTPFQCSSHSLFLLHRNLLLSPLLLPLSVLPLAPPLLRLPAHQLSYHRARTVIHLVLTPPHGP
jgi:hypothetical protein